MSASTVVVALNAQLLRRLDLRRPQLSEPASGRPAEPFLAASSTQGVR